MANLKVIIVFALSAMILAILAGGIGGVPFWEIIVRSLFAAVIFGGLGFGIGLIIDRFLPELSSPGSNGAGKTEKGTEIDEMIDAENPYESFQGDFDGDLESGDIMANMNSYENESTDSQDSSDLSNIEETAISGR